MVRTARETDVTIRVATRRDTSAIDALLARSYPKLLKPDYPPSVLVLAIPLISRAQPKLITSGTYYVAEEGGTIVGAGGWTPGRRTGVANVRHLVTDDRVTRRGVGRALMEHSFATARAAGAGLMHTQSTLTAVPFYTALGFERIKEITVPLGPAIALPCVSMIRPL